MPGQLDGREPEVWANKLIERWSVPRPDPHTAVHREGPRPLRDAL